MVGGPQIISTANWLLSRALSKLPSMIGQASSASSSAEQELHKQELRKLERRMKRIHAKLADAQERDIIDKSEQLRLSELREVAYDVEDLIDEYEYEVLRVKVAARRRAMAIPMEDDKHDKVFDWNSYCPEVSISDDMMRRTREIREKFEEITDDWKRINLGEDDLERSERWNNDLQRSEEISLRQNNESRRNVQKLKPIERESTSFFDEDNTFGREEEKDKIIEWLLQGGDEPHAVSLLAIIGMGGIGKTTLAQLVYNDSRVSKHFDLHAWVCVSEVFDVAKILRNIIYSFSGTQYDKLVLGEDMNLDLLYRHLKDQLEGKKYFIVLDDVWNQQLNLWQSLKRPFTGVGTGKIIVTTRNEKVASVMEITTSIRLKELPFTDCMSLFERIAFRCQNRNKLSDIGQSIVKKCKGIPLAIKVLAGILRFEEKEEEWNDVLESELWEIENENNNVLPILKLSYDHMPKELRPCFMYLSLFHKDSLLRKNSVVRHWMSQGFLQTKGKKTEEDLGDSYFDELLQRSILQYSEAWSKVRFVMHDLIHDLAQFVAKDEYLMITTAKLNQNMTQNIPGSIRHMAIYLNHGDDEIKHVQIQKCLLETKRLRTLLLHEVDGFSIAGSLHNLTCLRTLVLKDYCFREPTRMLSDAFGNLKHLRFLNVNRRVNTLEPICSLYHLQSFDSWRTPLEACEGVGDLINLRHLHIGSSEAFMHYEVGWLTNLRTLKEFKIGADSWGCKPRDLKDLTNLRGRIEISGLENIKCSDLSHSGADLEEMLQGIEELKLTWCTSYEDEKSADPEQVMSHFRPHPNLLELRIEGYPGASFPAWFGDASFSKLVEIQLQRISECTSLPTLGQLPALKRLWISDMKKVEIVGPELLRRSSETAAAAGAATSSIRGVRCFPSLEELSFIVMLEWKEWNGVEDCDFPKLSKLTIVGCPNLRTFPSLHSLTHLEFICCWDVEAPLSNCCLPMLQTLRVCGFLNFTLVFPDCQSLRSLKVLIIDGGDIGRDLKYIKGLGKLTSLERLEIRGCHKARISGHEQLPPSLRDVQIEDSPKVERWYKNHVLGGGGDGSVDTQQLDSDSKEEE